MSELRPGEGIPEEEKAAKDSPAEGAKAPAPKKTEGENPSQKEKKKDGAKKPKNPFKSKRLKHGSLSVAFTVIFVAAIVLINVIFNLALDRFDVKADMTEGAIFTMGDELRGFSADDRSTVRFYFTSDEETLENAGDTIYKQTVELVKQIAAGNAGYTVEYVDLLTNPAFAQRYSDAGEGGLIVECEETGRSKSFNIAYDFKRYVMSDGNSYGYSEAQMMSYYGYTVADQTSIAEQEILSALLSVTKVNPVRVAFSTGFGETENAGLTELLEKNSYVVETLDVDLAAEIPSETDVLVLNGPTMDYSDDVLNKIDEWLSNGGLFGKNLVYFATVTQPVSTPNLNAFLAEWGLSVGESFVLQMDANYAYAVAGYSSMPLYQRAEIMTDTDYYAAMSLGANTSFRANGIRPVYRLWDEQSNFQNTTILRTYGEDCVIFPFDATEDWTEESAERGQFDLITEAAKVRFDGATPIYSRVIAAGSELIFSESFLTATNYNNAEVAVALFNTISGNTGEQITIAPKSFTATTYEIDSAQQTGIGLTFAVFIPIAIMILGIAVWIRRRHL
ncbi:MAG: GldG family protein [Bacteroides sp.]|nr:GldG family protein [Eubacterium sp.]MCM1419474.1 GldG family protein [Roseburia sp.]MCM1463298.1 GldG family protein [Bacteroides sp.]